MTSYTEGFKEQMVRRLMAPPGMSVRQLATETGVSKSQLWKWKVARRMTAAKSGDKKWSAAEKLRVLGGGEAPLEGEALGAMLRREGLHEAQVSAERGGGGPWCALEFRGETRVQPGEEARGRARARATPQRQGTG